MCNITSNKKNTSILFTPKDKLSILMSALNCFLQKIKHLIH